MLKGLSDLNYADIEVNLREQVMIPLADVILKKTVILQI